MRAHAGLMVSAADSFDDATCGEDRPHDDPKPAAIMTVLAIAEIRRYLGRFRARPRRLATATKPEVESSEGLTRRGLSIVAGYAYSTRLPEPRIQVAPIALAVVCSAALPGQT